MKGKIYSKGPKKVPLYVILLVEHFVVNAPAIIMVISYLLSDYYVLDIELITLHANPST